MQLQGHAEVMVPISLVVLNNRGLLYHTGAVLSHQTLDKKKTKEHMYSGVFLTSNK